MTEPMEVTAPHLLALEAREASLKARIGKLERALTWIVNSPSAHPANMVKVAEDALQPKERAR